MTAFESTILPADRTAIAPDGSDVRVLLGFPSGSMAHFELAAGCVSKAVTHRTVSEVWYVLSGRGQMWRKQHAGVASGLQEQIVTLVAGVCLTIPRGTYFQFCAAPEQALCVLGVTMPAWPGEDEAQFVAGPWTPSARS